MKVGCDLRNGLNRRLSSWKNSEDPSPGELTYGIVHPPYPEALKNKSVISRLVVNQTTSALERPVWIESDQIWKPYFSWPQDYCDDYDLCGANGICDLGAPPVCQCLQGFKPKSPEKWKSMDWSQGCIRNEPLNCHSTEGFLKFVGLKVPDTANCWVNQSMNLNECRDKCLKNCSCMAYTNLDIRENGSGCAIWIGDLIDIRQFATGGDNLYIRMPASSLEGTNNGTTGKSDPGEAKDGTKWIIPVSIVATIGGIAGILLVSYHIWKGKTKAENGHSEESPNDNGLDLPSFNLATISIATNNFSTNNKLGQEERATELIDTLVEYSCIYPEIFRSIHVGLLCVQQQPEDRPNMLSVVLMLSGESVLPQPKQPGFLIEVQNEAHPSSSNNECCSANEMTVTLLEAR
ncbi:unnamed protein product [Ilex paraguariensis]|uniref:non-specific serine/threonine protein kinase n=1 Tax=Ilex paraguariensis TaxID=185542 RepID=A0ABC8RYJ0_9AQUA